MWRYIVPSKHIIRCHLKSNSDENRLCKAANMMLVKSQSMKNKNSWVDPKGLLGGKTLVQGEEEELSTDDSEFAKVKQEYE